MDSHPDTLCDSYLIHFHDEVTPIGYKLQSRDLLLSFSEAV
jgi:hypothetical protein